MIIKIAKHDDKDLRELINELDEGLKITDGDEHDFYHQFNGLNELEKIYVGYVEGVQISCGGFKILEDGRAELKRMYVRPQYRGNRYAESLLKYIENEVRSAGVFNIVLETGIRQESALKLYKRNAYIEIDKYGQYKGKALSICLGKSLDNLEM